MKMSEITEMTQADLAEAIQTEKAKYAQMLLNHAVSPLQNNSLIKIARRNIARMETVLRQKALNK